MDGRKPIYLDNNATTPLDERALEEMLPYLRQNFGNAASSHSFGSEAKAAVDLARERLASAIGGSPEEVVFTGGATESDNLALLGGLQPGDHLITATTEHEAVLEVARYAEGAGVRLTVLPVDEHGVVHPDSLRQALTPETALVSIMLANNETGTIHPIAELAEVAREHGIPFHTDAAQATAKIPINVEELGVDMMSLSAHKCYGPKGVGALYVRRRRRLEPILHGGGQERGLRSGTLNVPGIVGLGKAAEIGAESLPEEMEGIRTLRDGLFETLNQEIPDISLNGHPEERLPNTLNVSFPGVRADDLLGELSGIAASAGSACASETPEPPHTLKAMGVSDELALCSLRLSLGRFNTREEVDRAGREINRAVQGLRTAPAR